MPTTPASPTPAAPTPPAAPAQKVTLKTILTDITVGLAAIATVGEGVLATLPAGSIHTGAAIGLPIIVALVASLRNLGG